MSDLRTTIEQLGPWYQNIEVEPGLWTNPALPNHPAQRWAAIDPFIGDVHGKTVLDIGCNAGFFAVRFKQLGASRVVALDIQPQSVRQTTFLARHFGVELEVYERQAYDIEDLGTFDLVLCLGLLYHLRHPLLMLDRIAAICRDRLFVQMVLRTAGDDFWPKDDYALDEVGVFEDPAFPKMFFIERSVNADPTNWWFANTSCLKAMLRSAGFTDITPTDVSDTFVCRTSARPPRI
jgi:tRNA (mo5U34)-methyltransferase